ncbi:unnamed protein product [marine sediment metagenome]|uniref:Uncharacterized protein n=1 Tax=marine sediment metagenome TaxID=412755 RepID=X1QXP3_9ZZZZ
MSENVKNKTVTNKGQNADATWGPYTHGRRKIMEKVKEEEITYEYLENKTKKELNHNLNI